MGRFTTYELKTFDCGDIVDRLTAADDAHAIEEAAKIIGRDFMTGDRWTTHSDGSRSIAVSAKDQEGIRYCCGKITATERTPGRGYWSADPAKRSKTPNARFFVWKNGGFVKLTLRPGEEIGFAAGGPTEEGSYSYAEGYRYDVDTLTIENEIDDSGRDCDGYYNHSRGFCASAIELAENDERRPNWIKDRQYWRAYEERAEAQAIREQATLIIDDTGNGRARGDDPHAQPRIAGEGFKHDSRLVVWNDSAGDPLLVVAAHSYLDVELTDDEARDMAREYVGELNGREEREPDRVI